MKLAAWNVNSIAIRLPQLLDWLAREQPDVVCLQETKVDDANFPLLDLQAAGYRCAYSGQKSYNGVALLTRAEASDVVYGIDGYEDEQKRVLSATVNDARIICMYVPNGERVDSDKYRYKLAWLDAFARWLTRYRLGAFRRNLGLRIDHILLSDELARDATGARIAKEMRGLERPSDHAPVITELE